MQLLEIKERIESNIPTTFVDVIDLGGGDHIRAIVVSAAFQGLPLIKQHKMVLDLFVEEINSNDVHALTVKTMTPEQFAALG
ncbi:MAG: BolA/IbaG family iron-sulfur metabolism protein [Oligoflexia bacterium]|nr:BolA/IbaG family iron-sulfur metabolism protein [Oligoflexia bacterium]